MRILVKVHLLHTGAVYFRVLVTFKVFIFSNLITWRMQKRCLVLKIYFCVCVPFMFISQNRGRKPRKKDQLKLFLTNLHLTHCGRINTIYFLLYSLKDPSPKPKVFGNWTHFALPINTTQRLTRAVSLTRALNAAWWAGGAEQNPWQAGGAEQNPIPPSTPQHSTGVPGAAPATGSAWPLQRGPFALNGAVSLLHVISTSCQKKNISRVLIKTKPFPEVSWANSGACQILCSGTGRFCK